METGSKPSSSSSLLKKSVHLKPDKDSELTERSLKTYFNISRGQFDLLKVSSKLKATEFIQYIFPATISNNRWSKRILEFTQSQAFLDFTRDTEVTYLISDSRVLFLPKSLHNTSKQQELFNLAHAEQFESETHVMSLSEIEAECIYSVPVELQSEIGTHPKSSFALWAAALVQKSKTCTAQLHVEAGQFALVIGKDQQLVFSNWFTYLKPEDILYFLMASLEGLNILHTDIKVVLSGSITKQSDSYTVLEKYIANLQFHSRPTTLSYAYSFIDLPEHIAPFIFEAACE